MMYSNPMFGSESYGYGSEPYGTTETPNSESNGHKANTHWSKHKHKHKHHATKYHKTGKKTLSIKVDKNSWISNRVSTSKELNIVYILLKIKHYVGLNLHERTNEYGFLYF